MVSSESTSTEATPEASASVAHLDLIAPHSRLRSWETFDERESLAPTNVRFTLASWPLTPYDIPPSTALPPDEELHLHLETYWAHVAPYYPGLLRSLFEKRLRDLMVARASGMPATWTAFHQSDERHAFLSLLFAMLSIAAVYLAEAVERAPQLTMRLSHGADKPRKYLHESDQYLEEAMRLLGQDPFGRACARKAQLWRCHSFILLSLREAGVGLIHHPYSCVCSFLFPVDCILTLSCRLAGAAFRLAQDGAYFMDQSESW